MILPRYLFAIVFAGLGAILLWKSFTSEHLAGTLIFGWLSADLFIVSIAYLRKNSRVFGKTDKGTMRPLPAIVMAPFLFFTWLVWRLQNLFSREPIWNEVMPGLFVGRRCSFDCLPPNATTVIDLTAEFPTPGKIRRHTKVMCIPTLDGCSPDRPIVFDFSTCSMRMMTLWSMFIAQMAMLEASRSSPAY